MIFIRQLGITFCSFLILISFLVFLNYLLPDRPNSQVKVSTFLFSILCFVFSIVQLRYFHWISSFSPQPKPDSLHERFKVIDIKDKELSFKEFISNWKYEKNSKFKIMAFISGIGQLVIAIFILNYLLASLNTNRFNSVEVYLFLLFIIGALSFVGILTLYLFFKIKRDRKY